MPKVSRLPKWWFAAASIVLLLSLVSTFAQSGRRLPNSKAVPVPTPEPEPTPAPTPEKQKYAFALVVGMDRESGFIGAPFRFYQAALDACINRLERSASVKVVAVHRDMSRGDAVRGAKSDKESYVVWLQLRSDRYGADHRLNDYGELVIDYTLLEPRTAKQIASGRTYQRAARKGNIILGPTTTGRTSELQAEYLLKIAAQDAAERILEALSLPAGRTTTP